MKHRILFFSWVIFFPYISAQHIPRTDEATITRIFGEPNESIYPSILEFRYKLDYRTFQNEIKWTEKILDEIYMYMKMFVGKSGFNSTQFEQVAPLIGNYLSELSSWVNNLPSSQNLTDQLRFVTTVYHTMVFTIESLKYFGTTDVDNLLVRPISFINVKLLTMFNSSGVPDIHQSGFKTQVGMFTHVLEFWDYEFQKMDDVHEKVNQYLTSELKSAQKTLQVLKVSIQNDTNPSS